MGEKKQEKSADEAVKENPDKPDVDGGGDTAESEEDNSEEDE